MVPVSVAHDIVPDAHPQQMQQILPSPAAGLAPAAAASLVQQVECPQAEEGQGVLASLHLFASNIPPKRHSSVRNQERLLRPD